MTTCKVTIVDVGFIPRICVYRKVKKKKICAFNFRIGVILGKTDFQLSFFFFNESEFFQKIFFWKLFCASTRTYSFHPFSSSRFHPGTVIMRF